MKTTGLLSALIVGLVGLSIAPAWGQRIQFPTAVPINSVEAPYSGATGSQVPGAGPFHAVQGGGGYQPIPGSPSSPPSTFSTIPPYGTSPTTQPTIQPGPAATFQGGIQSPPSYDPYATPGGAPPTVFPQDPTLPVSSNQPAGTITTMQRFLQEIRFEYLWMPGTASEEFGINEADVSATFAIPFLHNPKTPLYITPGFGIHFWNGPNAWDVPPGPPGNLPIDIPPRAFDAYLSAAWHPEITPTFTVELEFRVGVHSDFRKIDERALRYQGVGLGVVALSPSFTIKAGVFYLDRQRFKLLPAGGLVWTPNDDIRFEILFPNPKLAVRLPGYGSCTWWFYGRGEYGGGSWMIKDKAPPGEVVGLDYNDLRFAMGFDMESVRGFAGHTEVGIAFLRELYTDKHSHFELNPTVFVGAGLSY